MMAAGFFASPSLLSFAATVAYRAAARLLVSWQSRQHEFAADRMMVVAAAANNRLFKVGDAIDGLETLRETTSLRDSRSPFATHPAMSERVRRLRSLAARFGLE